jgi:hypothetical protein
MFKCSIEVQDENAKEAFAITSDASHTPMLSIIWIAKQWKEPIRNSSHTHAYKDNSTVMPDIIPS